MEDNISPLSSSWFWSAENPWWWWCGCKNHGWCNSQKHKTGADAILLGADTMRGLYPVETISIVGKICGETTWHEPMPHHQLTRNDLT
ncbi:hypothetical protein L1987_57567 [Smallanthus sonchifolius]|uniref:Uncharacterized protein n=1 Tax=Smallanthus sonchifolius TaxID=185202 RepID=A0ACB9DDD0_9ASTR|nr:hypothetical protein L1987_57567 [Smallanthus sonchifolius]